jgi:predicted ArsR family transcriptional regulator
MLKKRPALSVNEMAKELGITEMAVRRHLNTLERDGLIASTLVRQSMGRPVHLYSLTEQADELFPKNYHHLALDILEEINQGVDGASAIYRLFRSREEKLFRQYRPRMKDKNLEERVRTLADVQNRGGYMAEWERDEQGDYLLHEYNCPITQVAHQYTQACGCELSLFERLLETQIERTECLTKGGGRCTYRIRRQTGP